MLTKRYATGENNETNQYNTKNDWVKDDDVGADDWRSHKG